MKQVDKILDNVTQINLNNHKKTIQLESKQNIDQNFINKNQIDSLIQEKDKLLEEAFKIEEVKEAFSKSGNNTQPSKILNQLITDKIDIFSQRDTLKKKEISEKVQLIRQARQNQLELIRSSNFKKPTQIEVLCKSESSDEELGVHTTEKKNILSKYIPGTKVYQEVRKHQNDEIAYKKKYIREEREKNKALQESEAKVKLIFQEEQAKKAAQNPIKMAHGERNQKLVNQIASTDEKLKDTLNSIELSHYDDIIGDTGEANEKRFFHLASLKNTFVGGEKIQKIINGHNIKSINDVLEVLKKKNETIKIKEDLNKELEKCKNELANLKSEFDSVSKEIYTDEKGHAQYKFFSREKLDRMTELDFRMRNLDDILEILQNDYLNNYVFKELLVDNFLSDSESKLNKKQFLDTFEKNILNLNKKEACALFCALSSYKEVAKLVYSPDSPKFKQILQNNYNQSVTAIGFDEYLNIIKNEKKELTKDDLLYIQDAVNNLDPQNVGHMKNVSASPRLKNIVEEIKKNKSPLIDEEKIFMKSQKRYRYLFLRTRYGEYDHNTNAYISTFEKHKEHIQNINFKLIEKVYTKHNIIPLYKR